MPDAYPDFDEARAQLQEHIDALADQRSRYADAERQQAIAIIADYYAGLGAARANRPVTQRAILTVIDGGKAFALAVVLLTGWLVRRRRAVALAALLGGVGILGWALLLTPGTEDRDQAGPQRTPPPVVTVSPSSVSPSPTATGSQPGQEQTTPQDTRASGTTPAGSTTPDTGIGGESPPAPTPQPSHTEPNPSPTKPPGETEPPDETQPPDGTRPPRQRCVIDVDVDLRPLTRAQVRALCSPRPHGSE